MSAPSQPHNSEPLRPANRLAHEKSPYLLQHAHNPVDWFPWGQEALETAHRENKPIFLSIGYSACHWCHVMERESFENDEVARILKQNFVSIKVDREERPDIDEIYMTAVQMMTGQGGWPLSVFLLPDGRPFYGGTYFPPENRYGRISFRSLITQLSDAFHNRREELEDVAGHLTAELQSATRQRPLSSNTDSLDVGSLLHAALQDMEARFDQANGGFGSAPKFPPHHALRLLLLASERHHDTALPILSITLERMAQGGIYDHIGGGFHRYATDAVWLLPHFEKMLYDNALLARVYADAYRVTDRAAYGRIAREVCDWVLRDLADNAGGLQSALDADSEGVEGKYYVWAQEEILRLLGSEVGTAFCRYYRILPGGNYREEATGHLTGANIPHISLGPTDTALPDELPATIAESRQSLLAHRYERIPPGKDDKVITSWNGLMIGALAFCGKTLNQPTYTAAAIRAANFCLTTLHPEGQLLHRFARGEAAISAFLDDYAFLADGLLDLYEATGDTIWADNARSLVDTLLTSFWDSEDGGFFFTGQDHEQLIARSKDLFDGALPAANGVAARVLVRLGQLPNGDAYQRAAQIIFHNYRGVFQRAANGTHTLLGAALLAQGSESSTAASSPITLTTEAIELTVQPGENLILPFCMTIGPGYHLNAHRPTHAHLIPTTATLTTDFPAAVGPVIYPEPMMETVAGDNLAVYSGSAMFMVPVQVASDASGVSGIVGLTIRYQACTESACLAPDVLHKEITLRVH